MQQLFPQEGESVPRLRFPEFVDSGEWEEKILGDVVNYARWQLYSRKSIFYENGVLNRIEFVNLISDTEPSEYSKIHWNRTYYLASKDDIINGFE